MKRTDVHRPGALVPADYRELFCFAQASTVDGWPCPAINIELLLAQRAGRAWPTIPARGAESVLVEPIRDDAGRAYPMAAIHKGGACDSCGAWFIEGSCFLHEPTGEAIVVGHICASKMELAYDESAAAIMSGQRKAARKRIIEKRARRFQLREFARESSRELLAALRCDHYIVQDIRARAIRWGNVSEKQAALVLKIAREAAEKAARPAEKHVPAPIADGRQTVEGELVSVKVFEGDYGSCLKMTVKVATPDGTWLAWGTAPAALCDAAADLGGLGRGCRVRFDAKLKAGRDAHFALFSRPTKAALLAVGADGREALTRLLRDLTMDGTESEAEATGEWADRTRANVAKLRGMVS